MLTAAQQKVKRELEELQINAHTNQNNKMSFPSNNGRGKKWIYSIIGFLSLVIICSLLLNDFSTQNQKEIVSYLAIVQKFNTQSEQQLHDLLQKSPANFQQTKEKQVELLKKSNDLKAPSAIKDHKQDLFHVMTKRLDVITYLDETKNSNSIQLNQKIMELHVQQELATDSLLRAFKRESIKYLLYENGNVQYWLQSKSYQYISQIE